MTASGSKSQQSPPTSTLVYPPLPVTLLSGFLGSGKTSLLSHILKSKSTSLRVAVIVNEITSINMDVVSLNGAKLLQSEEKMVEMSNGCICCTLRMDLLQQLRDLYDMHCFDAVVIESSGIADPMETAETFFVQLSSIATGDGDREDAAKKHTHASSCRFLQDFAPLDCCVSVVDASTLLDFVNSSADVRELQQAQGADGSQGKTASDVPLEDERSISELLFGQLEFANVIVANKMDLLSPTKRDEVLALLKTVNSKAKVVPSSFGQVQLHQVLKTNLFNEEFARSVSTHWMSDLNDPLAIPHVPETVQYQLSTCSFHSQLPFHPKRLFDWLTTYFVLNEVALASSSSKQSVEEPRVPSSSGSPSWKSQKVQKDDARRHRYGELFRGKGTAWLGNARRDDIFVSWSQCGSILTFASGGYWDEYPWPTPNHSKHQQLVFVGRNLTKELLLADLERLVLTPDEVSKLEKVIGHPCGAVSSCSSDDEEDEEDDDKDEELNNGDVFEDPFEPFYASEDDSSTSSECEEGPPSQKRRL